MMLVTMDNDFYQWPKQGISMTNIDVSDHCMIHPPSYYHLQSLCPSKCHFIYFKPPRATQPYSDISIFIQIWGSILNTLSAGCGSDLEQPILHSITLLFTRALSTESIFQIFIKNAGSWGGNVQTGVTTLDSFTHGQCSTSVIDLSLIVHSVIISCHLQNTMTMTSSTSHSFD